MNHTTASEPLLEARQIRKQFPGVLALDGVSMRVEAGEVLAIVGENGAGKSTLMKVLAGIHRPNEGELRMRGQPFTPTGVADAMAAGIVLIHQELNLAENLSIAANLFLGQETGRFGWLHRRSERQEAAALIASVGLDAAPDRRVETLSPGQKQLVEIARALARSASVIIMDEPTSSLTQRETDRLYEVIEDLKRRGVAVLYISHRLAEVKRVADRVTVLRDGKNAGELKREQITHDALVRMMVGRDLKNLYPRSHQAGTQVRLEVEQLCHDAGPHPLSFTLRGGEIVGMAGLVGAGRTELAEALFGIRKVVSGTVRLDGVPLQIRHPREAVFAGLLLVPEDRRLHGLILDFSIQDNLALPNYDEISHLGWVVSGKVHALSRRMMEKLRVRAYGPSQPVGLLSGGNQQKVVVGKWLARQPRVLIFDEPTRGVDVGARSEIYALMDQLASEGVAILMISSDMEEILGMSDRVLVLHEGRLTGELSRDSLTEEAVMHLATGGGATA
ncbi:MAG: sugar ABC transporter ATP-binding protein [Gemmataceae bacterium]